MSLCIGGTNVRGTRWVGSTGATPGRSPEASSVQVLRPGLVTALVVLRPDRLALLAVIVVSLALVGVIASLAGSRTNAVTS